MVVGEGCSWRLAFFDAVHCYLCVVVMISLIITHQHMVHADETLTHHAPNSYTRAVMPPLKHIYRILIEWLSKVPGKIDHCDISWDNMISS